MKILKFGGTSIGTPERFKKLPALLQRENEQAVVILSAIAGTTDHLESITGLLQDKEYIKAGEKAEDLERFYSRFIYGLFEWTGQYNQARLFVESRFIRLFSLMDKTFSEDIKNEILAQGELLSTGLSRCLFDSVNYDYVYFYAPDFLVKQNDEIPDQQKLKMRLSKVINEHKDNKIFITQGYICSNRHGKIDTLGRGGSDFTASLIGAALDVSEIQIWTDVDGMHNNDPRVVEETRPVPELSYEEADELAYFGAKVLHPECVFPAQQKNIPIRIKNTMNPDAPGTLIQQARYESAIKAVAAKEGITAIRIRSARMLMAYGFLRKVFEIFERYKTPIDMISTSEISVSLTIDSKTYLKQIIDELKQLGVVEVDEDQVIVCVVGDFMAEKPGIIRHVLNALKDIPVRMISYGGSMNNVSLLLHAGDKTKALQALHHYLFLNRQIHVN